MKKTRIELELRLADHLIPLLDSGEKRITIRYGTRNFADQITIAGRPVVVDSVNHYSLGDIPLRDLMDDGFATMLDVMVQLQRFYPDLDIESAMTVVRFHLCPTPGLLQTRPRVGRDPRGGDQRPVRSAGARHNGDGRCGAGGGGVEEVETVTPPDHIIQFAVEASLNSPCQSKRGAAIFEGDDLISIGWNGKPRGFDCDGSNTCKSTCRREAIHAEQMALIHSRCFGAEMLHVKTVEGRLVPSGGPSCMECSKLILCAGIAAMWLYHDDGWRRYTAHEFHQLTLEATHPTPEVHP